MTEISAGFLRKARRSLRSAELLIADGDFESAGSRAYYAMFYVAKALLAASDIPAKTHSGVHHRIWEHYVKPGMLDARFHNWLIDAFDQRLQSDYNFSMVITNEDVMRVIQRAREFLAAAEPLLA